MKLFLGTPLTLLVIVLTHGSLFSQADSLILISGVVRDSESKNPIEYAHLYIPNTSIGTITNSEGIFFIKLPSNFIGNELLISSIGFNSHSIKISHKLQPKEDILLIPATYQLKEVTVSAKKYDSSAQILKLAIQNIENNYTKKPHLLEGFFRESTIQDTVYTRIIEAAIRIQEVGYQKNTIEEGSMEMIKNRVKVIEIRKTNDLRKKDFLSKAFTWAFGERNELYALLLNNYVRILGKKSSSHFLAAQSIAKLDIELTKTTEWEGEVVYQISVKDVNPKMFQWTEFTFFIKKEDYAILSIDFKAQVNPPASVDQQNRFIEGKYFSTSHIEYRKMHDKYFPVFIDAKHFPSGASTYTDNTAKSALQFVHTQFLLTNLYTDNFSKIKWKDAEKRDKDLYESKREYNEYFWNSYNVIKLDKLVKDPTKMIRIKSLKD